MPSPQIEADYETFVVWHLALSKSEKYVDFKASLKRIPKNYLKEVCSLLTEKNQNLLEHLLAGGYRGRAIALLRAIDNDTLKFLVEACQDKQLVICLQAQIYNEFQLNRLRKILNDLGLDKENAYIWTQARRAILKSTAERNSAFDLLEKNDFNQAINIMRSTIADLHASLAIDQVTEREVLLKFRADLVMMLMMSADYFFQTSQFADAVSTLQDTLAEARVLAQYFSLFDTEEVSPWWKKYWGNKDSLISDLRNSLCDALYFNANALQKEGKFPEAILHYQQAITELNSITPNYQHRENLPLYEFGLQQALQEYRQTQTCYLRPRFFNRNTEINSAINSLKHKAGEIITIDYFRNNHIAYSDPSQFLQSLPPQEEDSAYRANKKRS